MADSETMRDVIVSMAVESWRFGRVFDRLLSKLDSEEKSRYQSQFHWFNKKVQEALEQADLRVVNVEGQLFDPGIAATPLNMDEFNVDDMLIIDQMIEPIIMGKEGVVKVGAVMLSKVVDV